MPVSRKVLMMTGAALATVGVCSIPAAAATIDWTSWNPGFTIGVPFGAASGTAGGVTVSYAGELESLVVGYPSYSPTSTYAGGVVGNVPNPREIILLFGGFTIFDAITFSTPVTDPVLAIWSLGQPGLLAQFEFNASPLLDAGGPSAEFGGSSISLSGAIVSGYEGNGTIDFPGTYGRILFSNPLYDGNSFGFTVGIPEAALIPEPMTLGVLGAGVVGVGEIRRRPIPTSR